MSASGRESSLEALWAEERQERRQWEDEVKNDQPKGPEEQGKRGR